METTTLDNGLRIVIDHRPGNIVYCGLAIEAGTRHQTDEESGMAHFTEHMSFKGTVHRSAWHIINRMEAVGGELNAYTGKEHTVYYCSTLRQHLSRALDLLFDITLHSTYPQHELEKEVEVVIDEIESYNDTPSELIYDDFEAMLFRNHPLGRNILGDAGRLRQYQAADVQRFARRLYRPERMVLFVLGDVSLRTLPLPRPVMEENVYQPDIEQSMETTPLPVMEGQGGVPFSIDKNTHQAHVIIGCQAYPMGHPHYTALYLLNNLLGGPGMNSRLNLALRERRGLVYTVESNLTAYTDTGLWQTYFGCDHADVERCRRLVGIELQRLLDAPLSPSALSAAKRQLRGQMALAWENGENVAIGMGRRLLHLGTTQTLQQFCDAVDSLTAPQLLDVAREVFDPARLCTLIYN
ncbi:MAG: insulinase family protein [Bacteroidaceae bacterium]|nr:insulinase family protein [Bacteroidaceae bacterium]